MLNSVGCYFCYTVWLLRFFLYKEERKSSVTNVISGYSDLFLSGFQKVSSILLAWVLSGRFYYVYSLDKEGFLTVELSHTFYKYSY